jgi:hypothetical protein
MSLSKGPRGSRVKFEYHPKLKTFTLSKSLLTGLTYPHDWGFVPSTKAEDGDPIECVSYLNGASRAFNSSFVAGSSPSHFAQYSSARCGRSAGRRLATFVIRTAKWRYHK